MLVGLIGPFTNALVLLRAAKSQRLWRDFKDRLVNPRRLNWRYLPVTILLMPIATYLAMRLSVARDRPESQLNLVPNLLAMVPIMFLAPILEELAWRGYAVDALRANVGMR